MSPDKNSDTEVADAEYGERVGERLRSIRRQKGMSLQDVEADSVQEFKASVLGAYERGERAISVPRLQRLAQVYDVPVDQLLPLGDAAGDDVIIDLTGRSGRPESDGALTLDLAAMQRLGGPEADMLSRYVRMIQVQRQDFNGRVLTVRRDDLRAIACILGVPTERARGRLDQLELSLSS